MKLPGWADDLLERAVKILEDHSDEWGQKIAVQVGRGTDWLLPRAAGTPFEPVLSLASAVAILQSTTYHDDDTVTCPLLDPDHKMPRGVHLPAGAYVKVLLNLVKPADQPERKS